MLTAVLISAAAALAGITYAFFLKRDEERRQEWRRLSRATWAKSH